jgi:hypothetical protein
MRKLIYIIAILWVAAFVWQTIAHAKPTTADRKPDCRQLTARISGLAGIPKLKTAGPLGTPPGGMI